MILLDTNVVSALMDPGQVPAVVAWLNLQPRKSVWTTAVTLFELHEGIERLPPGRRRDSLARSVSQLVDDTLQGRVLPFDGNSVVEAAHVGAIRRAMGRRIAQGDTMIAGIARLHHATLATRNIRDFEGVGIPLIDPWTA